MAFAYARELESHLLFLRDSGPSAAPRPADLESLRIQIKKMPAPCSIDQEQATDG